MGGGENDWGPAAEQIETKELLDHVYDVSDPSPQKWFPLMNKGCIVMFA